MKAIKIGAFEAKTHFSELLRAVESGKEYEIVRRGRPVARLLGHADDGRKRRVGQLLEMARSCRGKNAVSLDDIVAWKKTGRP